MATKKTKYHYYILVFTDDGPKYVTSTEYHTARWDYSKPPKEFTKEWAQDIATGLMLNWHNAVVVQSKIEIESQPYRYSEWKITFVEREQEEEDEDQENEEPNDD